MVKNPIGMFAALFLFSSSFGFSQEASRYFPLEQDNTWTYYHKHTVYEGVAIKPAAIQGAVVTADTVTLRVSGTVTGGGKTYAVLAFGENAFGSFRVDGNYLCKLSAAGERKIVDLTPSEDAHYQMAGIDFLPTIRDIETRTLPCGEMTGYGCPIESSFDALHEGKYLFFVESVGPAFISLFDGWKIPPVSDTYSLISYNVKINPVSVREDQDLPVPMLFPAAPNPFNSATTISYSLPEPGQATLTIYDITGRKVRTLVRGTRSAGSHSVVWNGCDDSGMGVSSGVYLSRLTVGNTMISSAKMLFMK